MFFQYLAKILNLLLAHVSEQSWKNSNFATTALCFKNLEHQSKFIDVYKTALSTMLDGKVSLKIFLDFSI